MTLVFDVVPGTVLVGLVLHNALVAIGLKKGVHSLGVVSIPRLPLALDVVVFQIVHGVVVVIVGRCLEHEKNETEDLFQTLDKYLLVFRAGCRRPRGRY